MAYQIIYAYTCHIGKVRLKNEDNFWCCEECLEMDHLGTDGVLTGEKNLSDPRLFGVFDGMGGECCGEKASCIAAHVCAQYISKYREKWQKKPQEFLLHLCRRMNRMVYEYSHCNRICSMGTTVALLMFDKTSVYSCNLGDSRIYHWNPSEMKQISTDHVFLRGMHKKGGLTQFAGLPEDLMLLDPCPFQGQIQAGDKYLLCSDGLTDMLADEEIQEILSKNLSVKEQVQELLEGALEKGGRDNITMILCEVREYQRKKSFRDRLKVVWKEWNKR